MIAGKILQDTEVYWTTGIIFEQRCRFVNFGVKVNIYKRNREFLKFNHGTKNEQGLLKTRKLVHRNYLTMFHHYFEINIRINMHLLLDKNHCFYKHYCEFLKFDEKSFLFYQYVSFFWKAANADIMSFLLASLFIKNSKSQLFSVA